MELRFWLDPETDLPHIFDHGVSEDEVRQVLGRTGKNCQAVTVRGYVSVEQTQVGICKLCTSRMLSAMARSLSPPST